jgi:hypothetical protein
MMTCTVPAGDSSAATSPVVPRSVMALLARVRPAVKLTVETVSVVVPPG